MTPWTKRLAVALALSVAINLLLGGFLIGRAARGRPHPGARDMAGEHAELRHPILRKAIDSRRDEFRASRKAAAEARGAVRDALVSEPFDAGRLEGALAELRKQTGNSQAFVHQALLDAAAKGTPETRKELARAFGRKRPRRPRP